MRTLAFVVAMLGCTGSAPPTPVDGSGGVCTKVLYDPCATEHDCTAGACHTFTTGGSAVEVCTQSCSSTAPCPNDSTGAPGTCTTDLMLCEPAKPNACTISL
jgi:hypothetical protein